MGLFEVILIGVALSADAMSVTLANMLANPAMRRARALSQPVAFGAFQGLMPLIGYFLGSLAAGYIEQFAGIVSLSTFLLCLLVLGIGRRFGEKLGTRAQVVGGAVLIAIGVKALFF